MGYLSSNGGKECTWCRGGLYSLLSDSGLLRMMSYPMPMGLKHTKFS